MEVFVTARAEKNFDAIAEYINQEWGNKTAQQFIQKTDNIFHLIKSYPLPGQVEKGNSKRTSVVATNKVTLQDNERQNYYSCIF